MRCSRRARRSRGDSRAERAAVLITPSSDLEGLAERGVAAMRAEIPAYARATRASSPTYATRSPALPHEARRRCSRTAPSRSRTSPSCAGRRCGGPARASRSRTTSTRSGSASRCSGRRCWSARARRPRGHAAALALATPLMRYVRLRQHARRPRLRRVPAVRGRRRRPRAARPARAPAGRRAADARPAARRRPGATASARGLADAGGRRRRRSDPAPDADAPHAASAAIARAGCATPGRSSSCARRRSSRCRVLGADGRRARHVRPACEAVQRRLRARASPLAIGVSTVATGVGRAPARLPGGARGAGAASATTAASRRCRGCRPSTTSRCAPTTPRGAWSTRGCARSSRRTARAAAC